MSVFDYLAPDQEVEIEILQEDKKSIFPGIVDDIRGMSIMIKVLETTNSQGNIINNTQAQISGTNGELGFKIPAKVVESSKFPLIKMMPEDELESTQRRNFVRIEDSLPCVYTVLSRDDYEKSTKDYLNRYPDKSEIQSLLSKIWHHEREVGDEANETEMVFVQLLINIDRKLSMVLDVLNQEKKIPMEGREARVIDMSGSGVKFFCKEVLALEQLLKIEMVLPTFPVSPITVFGDVTRVEKEDNDGESGFNIIVQFTTINEDNRDSLIRYIFQRQREILRATRGNKD
ncbi:MAG: PilZ domain-containing protein [Thermodesulfobacteriota bacterium]|nr:PilZ domain-containing protein [Thermodesulfobacteriota bacterium]